VDGAGYTWRHSNGTAIGQRRFTRELSFTMWAEEVDIWWHSHVTGLRQWRFIRELLFTMCMEQVNTSWHSHGTESRSLPERVIVLPLLASTRLHLQEDLLTPRRSRFEQKFMNCPRSSHKRYFVRTLLRWWQSARRLGCIRTYLYISNIGNEVSNFASNTDVCPSFTVLCCPM
jgi:hypothetical protein